MEKSYEGASDNPMPSTSVHIFKAVWSIIPGLTLFKEESYLLVADPGFNVIRSIKREKKRINKTWRLS